MTSFEIGDGIRIPAIGFGTFRSKQEHAYQSVLHALSVGYRHVDTAEIYGNEGDVGRALADSPVDRSDVFVTSKLWNSHRTAEDTKKALDATLVSLRTDYLDLYLIHWPGPDDERVAEVWSAMEEAVDAGKTRSIGVSNFHVHRITTLLESARIKPAVNQVECHPYLQNTFLRNFCAKNGLRLEAYAPLNSDHVADLLDDKVLNRIASIHGRTVPQIVLRWHIQCGVIPLPKSVTKARIKENFQVFDFELSDAEMKGIRRINRASRNFPDPDDAEFGFTIA